MHSPICPCNVTYCADFVLLHTTVATVVSVQHHQGRQACKPAGPEHGQRMGPIAVWQDISSKFSTTPLAGMLSHSRHTSLASTMPRPCLSLLTHRNLLQLWRTTNAVRNIATSLHAWYTMHTLHQQSHGCQSDVMQPQSCFL